MPYRYPINNMRSRRLGLHSVSSALKLAVAVWVIGPLPLITNAAFMKQHRVFVVSYVVGWLTKLVIVAVAVGWFLRCRSVNACNDSINNVGSQARVDFGGANQPEGSEERSRTC
jgi:hypothetical protein